MLNFSQELRIRRKAAKLSLKTLGSMSGVSDSTISKIEKKESSNLRWDTVCVLTKALKFTEDEFTEFWRKHLPQCSLHFQRHPLLLRKNSTTFNISLFTCGGEDGWLWAAPWKKIGYFCNRHIIAKRIGRYIVYLNQ